jgi:TatD DNase family protein
MQLFDSHCHFDFPAFDQDRASLWQTCQQQGISHLLMPGVSPEQWPLAAQLCAKYPGLVYAAGLHPHWISKWVNERMSKCEAEGMSGTLAGSDQHRQEFALQKISQLIEGQFSLAANGDAGKCVAVGECGLDKLIATPLALQQQVLHLHIDLANQLHKPLIIHSVKTHNEMLVCFKYNPPRYGGVIHAFSGSLELAQQFVARGFMLGVGGTISYERAQKTRHALSQIPLEYLVLETDAPDMPLQGRQGQRNSPEYLAQIAQILADLRGVAVQDVAAATSANALRLFHCR